MLSQTKREGRRSIRHGSSRDPGRSPCYLEGTDLFLAWLSEEELHGAWKQLRLKPDDGHMPGWLTNPQHNDFSYRPPDPPYTPFEPFWVSLIGRRAGWLCLSGMTQHSRVQTVHDRRGKNGEKTETVGYFDWGVQAYNTFFLPASVAVPRLAPKYDKIRRSVYDHINMGGAVE